MFLSNLNILKPFWFIIRFLSLILMLPLLKSFLALKILILQFNKYYILLRFTVYVSPLVFIAQISVLLLKPNNLAFLLAMLITGKDAGVYVPVVKSLINLAICVSALILNNMLSCLIGDQSFCLGVPRDNLSLCQTYNCLYRLRSRYCQRRLFCFSCLTFSFPNIIQMSCLSLVLIHVEASYS
jgi:hypothetical protein